MIIEKKIIFVNIINFLYYLIFYYTALTIQLKDNKFKVQ